MPLACAYPTNQWGRAVEDLTKTQEGEVNASLNHDEHTHTADSLIVPARLQVHWLLGRLPATAARFNYQAITDWERKVVSVLDKTAGVDARLVTYDAVRSFPRTAGVRCRLWIWLRTWHGWRYAA